jgi:hypothetical protein
MSVARRNFMRPRGVYTFMSPLILAYSLFLAAPAAAQTAPASVPFNPGERLEYAVSYGVLPAGSMTVRVAGVEEYAGRSAYHFVFEAKSNRAVSFLYELATTEEAWFDTRELYSLRYRRVSTENDKQREKDVRFDQERHLRIENGESKPTSPRAVDPVSMMYFLRTLSFRPGATYVLSNQADPNDNPLTARILKQERIRVPAGTYDTFVIDIDVRTDSGIFKKGGDNRVWVTSDARHIPVKISSKIGVGSFQAELVDFAGGRPLDFAR